MKFQESKEEREGEIRRKNMDRGRIQRKREGWVRKKKIRKRNRRKSRN